MDTKYSVRGFVKRSKWALIGYIIWRSLCARFRFSRGRIDSFGGSTHIHLSTSESVAYVNRQFEDYLRYGKLSPENLKGKRILEGGPGGNLGVALRFLVCGAKQVVMMDKFYPRQDSEQQRRIYLALREQFSAEEKRTFDRSLDLSDGVVIDEAILTPMYGKGMEEVGDLFDENSFDVIISRAVIQEIFDTDRLFAGMDKVLRRGGKMLHAIDLRDYGTFSSNGHHPLTFLTIPDSAHKLMVCGAYRLNHKTFDYYRTKMQEHGFHFDLYITMVQNSGYAKPSIDVSPHKTDLTFGVDYDESTLRLVRSIRPRLAKRFVHVSDMDLMVAGLFLVACKPT